MRKTILKQFLQWFQAITWDGQEQCLGLKKKIIIKKSFHLLLLLHSLPWHAEAKSDVAHTSWLYWEIIPFFSFKNHQLAPFSCISELPGFVPRSNGRSSLQNLDQYLTWTRTSTVSRLWICLVLLWREPQHMTFYSWLRPLPLSDLHMFIQDKNSGSCLDLSPTPTLLQRHVV